jgi:ABC-type branched-subunit amino acid transport system substrate-binding protein
MRYAESRNAYMPRHIPRGEARELKRIAVLLPFSSTDPEVRRLTTALFNAVQMAMFEVGDPNVVLIPRDTYGDAREVSQTAKDAINDGSVAVIGPLFAQHVGPVAQIAATVRAPVLAFSTDVSANGQGAYLVSLTPKTEVQRIVDWAATQGITRFAMFGPDTTYGHTVEQALREQVAVRGGLVIGAEYYAAGDTSPQAQARRLATVVKAENAASPGKVAVLFPERGIQLRTAASLLPYFDVNPRQVRFLGTGFWNDPDVWREPSLYGGAFPAPDPAALADFEKRYQAIYGEVPPRLASFGYDAGALAANLAKLDRLDAGMMQREEGWRGVNGLFRFMPDGSIERGLAVLQLQDGGGAKIVSPAMTVFTPGS